MRIPAAERLLAFLGYVPILPLWLLPIMVRRDSMFCQFHGRQAGVLWGLWIVPTAILFITGLFVLSGASEGSSLDVPQAIVFGIMFLILVLYTFFALVGMYKSLARERYRMPVVADVALLLRL